MRNPSLYVVLRFPDRAENLRQYSGYEVHLDHWQPLSNLFMRRFQEVYERGNSAVLLVHGPQGSGKTLFGQRLEADYKQQSQSESATPRPNNLGHVLVGGDQPDATKIREATARATVRKVSPTSGWFEAERSFAANDDKMAVRVFLFDDALKDGFLSQWAGLTAAEWLKLKVEDKTNMLLDTVAERIVEVARGDFQRSIFVMLSNDAERLDALHTAIERVHAGLSERRELPLPRPGAKERIIRTNTNRLNDVSYWYCLDTAAKEERVGLHTILTAPTGFTDSFRAVNTALSRRVGRPANRNLLTLVTLGSSPAQVRALLQDKELLADDGDSAAEETFMGEHLGMWFSFNGWAEAFARGGTAERARQAKMLQSEFSLRWVALDVNATWHLMQPPAPGSLGDRIEDVLRFVPSVAHPKATKGVNAKASEALDRDLQAAPIVPEFEATFRALKRDRSGLYEPALAQRFKPYSADVHGYPPHEPRLKPDYTASVYTVCAITNATPPSDATISAALKRTGHFLEFTSFLGNDLEGLDEYIGGKIERYARMLEVL